jgi:hypothetical protein
MRTAVSYVLSSFGFACFMAAALVSYPTVAEACYFQSPCYAKSIGGCGTATTVCSGGLSACQGYNCHCNGCSGSGGGAGCFCS